MTPLRKLQHSFRTPLVEDRQGLVSFALVASVFFSYAFVTPDGESYVFSSSLAVEVAGHIWLLLGPPLGAYLGARHLASRGTSLLPLVTVPLGVFLTLLTFVGVGVSMLGS